jgi:hypothetical protein
VRVWDAENAIYEGLRSLSRRRYLFAMWILCGELRALYSDSLTDAERTLMMSTLDLVQEMAAAGYASTRAVAEDLVAGWQELITVRQDEVLPGRSNAWVTFQDLAAELAGTSQSYDATERLTLAATDRWRDPYRRGPIRVDPDEEVEDASPMAITLAMFQRVVAGAARLPETVQDPADARSRILGPDE